MATDTVMLVMERKKDKREENRLLELSASATALASQSASSSPIQPSTIAETAAAAPSVLQSQPQPQQQPAQTNASQTSTPTAAQQAAQVSPTPSMIVANSLSLSGVARVMKTMSIDGDVTRTPSRVAKTSSVDTNFPPPPPNIMRLQFLKNAAIDFSFDQQTTAADLMIQLANHYPYVREREEKTKRKIERETESDSNTVLSTISLLNRLHLI
jgi:hypothetical protein